MNLFVRLLDWLEEGLREFNKGHIHPFSTVKVLVAVTVASLIVTTITLSMAFVVASAGGMAQ